MMMMVVCNKMNSHVICSKNEANLITLNADDQFMDEDEALKDSLFFDIKLNNKDILYLKIFNKIGAENSIISR